MTTAWLQISWYFRRKRRIVALALLTYAALC